MALQMKPACEKCEVPLGWSSDCYICSYECTWCPGCTTVLEYRCPNCGGELVPRPKRREKPGDIA